MTDEMISMCLPKGGAMKPLAELLGKLKFPVKEYHSKNRTYRPVVEDLPVRTKIMAEKDVAIQIAAGNYDVGFCGLDWVLEHTIKYRAARIHVLKHLGLDEKGLYLCSGLGGNIKSVDDLHRIQDYVTIVSEYPNLAENFAMTERLRKFKVFSAWGSVEVYPPEHADLVLLAVEGPGELRRMGLQSVVSDDCYLESNLCLVVNRESFREKNLSPVVEFFSEMEG